MSGAWPVFVGDVAPAYGMQWCWCDGLTAAAWCKTGYRYTQAPRGRRTPLREGVASAATPSVGELVQGSIMTALCSHPLRKKNHCVLLSKGQAGRTMPLGEERQVGIQPAFEPDRCLR